MPHIKKVFDWFDNNIEIFSKLKPKTLLYVGYTSQSSLWWFDKFCVDLEIEKATLVDIFEPNVKKAKEALKKKDIDVILGDIRKINEFSKKGEFDIVFWDHGPEHADEEDIDPATALLKEYVGKCLIYCCPWGDWPQGSLYGNEWEKHRTEVIPEMFERNEMTVITFGTMHQCKGGKEPGELAAYWFKND